MAQCLKCGAEDAERHFRVLEVQTLHVRDLDGEKRVQALGRFQDWAVCGHCATDRTAAARTPGKRLMKRCLPFGLVLLAGVALTALVRSEVPVLKLLGPAAMFCGLAGGISNFRKEQAKNRALRELPQEEALRKAAWECLMESAPKKDGENDLTYIPVDLRTQTMKTGDLMLQYDLLPAIAVKTHDLLQREMP